MRRVGLTDLVAPVSPARFLSSVWGRAPQRFPGTIADPASIMDLDGLESVLATAYGAGDGWLHLAEGGRERLPLEMVDHEGMLDLVQVRGAVQRGQSLYLTKAERRSPSLMAVARAVESDLGELGVLLRRSVGAHVFFSPAGAQAFRPHRDEHASFALQLDGAKTWTVHSFRPDPSRPGAADPAELDDADVQEFRLEPGDVLYVPEGWVHAAATQETHSLHATLRVFPLRWSDLLTTVAQQHPGLSGAIGPRNSAPGDLARDLDRLLASPQFGEPLEELIDVAVRSARVPRVALAGDGLRQTVSLGAIGSETRLCRSPGTVCAVGVEGGESVLRFPGGVMRGEPDLTPMFRFVAEADFLTPDDLLVPGATQTERLDLARQLVSNGILRRVTDPGHDGAGDRPDDD